MTEIGPSTDRRGALQALAAAGTLALAGCSVSFGGKEVEVDIDSGNETTTAGGGTTAPGTTPVDTTEPATTTATTTAPESTTDSRTTYTYKEGDTLWEIADKYYGDPTKWEQIAEANDLEDPRSVPVGTTLIIPNATAG